MKECKPLKRVSRGNQKYLFDPDLKIGDRLYLKGTKTKEGPDGEGKVFQVE